MLRQSLYQILFSWVLFSANKLLIRNYDQKYKENYCKMLIVLWAEPRWSGGEIGHILGNSRSLHLPVLEQVKSEIFTGLVCS